MKDKKYEMKEVAEIIAKSMSKSIKKSLKPKGPVEDLLDPDFQAESPSSTIPEHKGGVLYKKDVKKSSVLEPEQLDDKIECVSKPSKNNKLKEFLAKKKSKK
jgi:hypothetical protein